MKKLLEKLRALVSVLGRALLSYALDVSFSGIIACVIFLIRISAGI